MAVAVAAAVATMVVAVVVAVAAAAAASVRQWAVLSASNSRRLTAPQMKVDASAIAALIRTRIASDYARYHQNRQPKNGGRRGPDLCSSSQAAKSGLWKRVTVASV